MHIENAKYTDADHTSIAATVDLVDVVIPVEIGNRHYDEIVSESIPIADYEGPSLAEVKETARDVLREYYNDYVRSQFDAGPDTYSAEDPVSLLVIAEIMRVDPTNTSQVVFDIAGDPHPVTDLTVWGQFWNNYIDLFDEARDAAGQGWQDVKAAGDEDAVQAVLDGLPPIPGT